MPETDDHGVLPPPMLETPLRVLIVTAPFYRRIADAQIAGAKAQLAAVGAEVELLEVPGALELAPAIRAAALSGRFDGFVALGCVIRGETTHYETVCEESARGITFLTVEKGLAIGNGVLTVENEAQALARARPEEMDKGGGAALACLHLIAAARRYRPKGFGGPGPQPDEEPIRIA